MNSQQLDLFLGGVKPPSPALQRFLDFHEDNPQVYRLFKHYATKARLRRDRYSARAIIHVIRWHTSVETDDPEGYKVSNNWSPFYARLLAMEDPRFVDFFVTHKGAAAEELKEVLT